MHVCPALAALHVPSNLGSTKREESFTHSKPVDKPSDEASGQRAGAGLPRAQLREIVCGKSDNLQFAF